MRLAKEKVLSIRAQLPRLGGLKLHALLKQDPRVPQIVGYKLSGNLCASSSIEALKMALVNRKRCTESLIHHS